MKKLLIVISCVFFTATIASADSGSFTFKTVDITWDAPAPASAVIANIESRSGKTIEHHMEVALSHMFDVLKRNYAGSKHQFQNLSLTWGKLNHSTVYSYSTPG